MSLLLQEKFFPFRVNPISEGFVIQASKEEITKVVSLCKNGRSMEVFTYALVRMKGKIIHAVIFRMTLIWLVQDESLSTFLN